MPTLSRARVVKHYMGMSYRIYWDHTYLCFRVMQRWSYSVFRDMDRYTFVE